MLKYLISDGKADETERPASVFLKDSDFDAALKNPEILRDIELQMGGNTVIGRLGKMNDSGIFEEQAYRPLDVESVVCGKGELGFYERVR